MMGTDRHPTRVAHVALQFDTGGMEKLLVAMAHHADRGSYALHFVSLTSRGKLMEEIEACDWPTIALEEPSGFNPRLVFRLAGLFRAWKIDIVHTHNEAPLIYGAPAAWLTGRKGIVQTRHGRSYGATGRQICLYRLASLLADRIVCVSVDTAKLSARQGIPLHKLVRIWNGVDVNRFAYSGPDKDGPAVLVARLSPEKDVATLLQATVHVVKALPSFRLEIAGDGPCLRDLMRQTRELGLDRQVRFLGEVQDVVALLRKAGLFVLSSLSEGISLTLLEAMARGLPVVATQVGGNPEVVFDGETGLLVPPRSPLDLAAAILRIYGDPDRGREMGLAGRRRVEAVFDIRQMVAAYESIYQSLLFPQSKPSRNALNSHRLPSPPGGELQTFADIPENGECFHHDRYGSLAALS